MTRRKSALTDVCRGLAYLHAGGMIHQDIKPYIVLYKYLIYRSSSNILLDGHFIAKLGDFGFCIDLPETSEGRTFVTAPLLARTQGYYAPEICNGKISLKSDVYSYGVVSL